MDGAVGSVAGAGSEALPGAVTPEGSDGNRTSLTPGAPGDPRGSATGAVSRGRSGTGDAPISVRAAEVAPLQRWLARVWPAIALGGDGSAGNVDLGVMARDLFRPTVAAATALLTAPAAALELGDSAVAGRSASTAEPQPPSGPFPVPSAGGKVLYLLALAALLVLMGFTVWREFHVALKPWQHRH